MLLLLTSPAVAPGWNDASVGPLLLRIREHYGVSSYLVERRLALTVRLSQVSFTVVSLTFVANFVGFLSAAIMNGWVCGFPPCVLPR